MKRTLIEEYRSRSPMEQFNLLPGRIFLDTNIVQYLMDFGEYIYDGGGYTGARLISKSGKQIKRNSRLYQEILTLKYLFMGRLNVELALSESVYEEVIRKKDASLTSWFFDVWDYWRIGVSRYAGNAFSYESQKRHQKAKLDNSLLGNLSNNDQRIILDAIKYDCDALLTADRFSDKNKQLYIYNNYSIMLLKPTDLLEILKPFQALWN